MKKIIYKGTIEENDYNRVKDIDSENYVTPDGKTVLPKLAQMPLRDLAILSFTSENELKKYYTGNEEYFSYSVVELMLDTRIQTRNLSRHKVSSFEDALYLLYTYSEEIPQADDPKYLSILIAADILNVEEEDIIEEARRIISCIRTKTRTCLYRSGGLGTGIMMLWLLWGYRVSSIYRLGERGKLKY